MDDLATRCRTVATRLSKPHSEHIKDAAFDHLNEAAAALAASAARIEALTEALEFYADPGTYFAVGFFPDPPCGEFMDDFDETELGMKPGKRARAALDAAPRSDVSPFDSSVMPCPCGKYGAKDGQWHPYAADPPLFARTIDDEVK